MLYSSLSDIRRPRSSAPFLIERKAALSHVQIDPLLHTRGRMDVEPLIYTLLVGSGPPILGPYCVTSKPAKFR